MRCQGLRPDGILEARRMQAVLREPLGIALGRTRRGRQIQPAYAFPLRYGAVHGSTAKGVTPQSGMLSTITCPFS